MNVTREEAEKHADTVFCRVNSNYQRLISEEHGALQRFFGQLRDWIEGHPDPDDLPDWLLEVTE